MQVNVLLGLRTHRVYVKPRSQVDHYLENKTDPELMKYVELSNGAFGSRMESLVQDWFGWDSRTDSGHDHRMNGKTIEQKSSRFTAKGGEWMWQHIELKHPWDYLLICGLNFNSINFYICSRDKIEELVRLGVITGQGKKDGEGVSSAQQAYWFSQSNFQKRGIQFSEYFKEITSPSDLPESLTQ